MLRPRMQPALIPIDTDLPIESIASACRRLDGVIFLHSSRFEPTHGRYSILAVEPFLRFRSWGARCEWRAADSRHEQFGNPWRLLADRLARYELLEETDLPFPTGGAFGYFGYDLKNILEPRLTSRAINDLELPDCALGFYDGCLIRDHQLRQTWIVATGLDLDGERSPARARSQIEAWRMRVRDAERSGVAEPPQVVRPAPLPAFESSLPRPAYEAAVARALEHIRAGDVYQLNLAQRLSLPWAGCAWDMYRAIAVHSPAPFSGYFASDDFALCSMSPELFLKMSGNHVLTRPIKGTRPRSADADVDARLSYELQSSTKERAELVMITDLLRNDLGRICEYGGVRVTELMKLERYSHVQHLVSTVEGRLQPGLTHADALASCFPGGSITGAPKIRAMQIIDELEPVSRGPYTGSLGYLGFNRESQFNILIRTALCTGGRVHYHAGAGIVADSSPAAEYDETMAKAGGFFEALRHCAESVSRPAKR